MRFPNAIFVFLITRDKVCLLHLLVFADQAKVQSQERDIFPHLFGKRTSLLPTVFDVPFEFKDGAEHTEL